jgi:hypothetical protein
MTQCVHLTEIGASKTTAGTGCRIANANLHIADPVPVRAQTVWSAAGPGGPVLEEKSKPETSTEPQAEV